MPLWEKLGVSIMFLCTAITMQVTRMSSEGTFWDRMLDSTIGVLLRWH